MIKSLIKIGLLVLLVASIVSCNNTAKINGNITGVKSSEVIIKLLDINKYQILDTVKVNENGDFSYKLEIEKGNPEFIYVFYKETKVASLLLDRGEAVQINADTLGTSTVEGSEETLKLIQVEKKFGDFSDKLVTLLDKANNAVGNPEEVLKLRKEITALYVDYYRDRVKYVLSNSHSLTSIPVLFQKIGGLEVFSQPTDVMHFRSICDSLEMNYPDSKFVKNLRVQAEKRQKIFNLQNRINSANQLDYPEIELSDIKGEKVKLSDIKSKVVMIHFWTNNEPLQKMFNLDVLKPAYDEFHSKGFEIYQVALDLDKTAWATTVKAQELDWINVCDIKGLNSPVISSYNVRKLPTSYFIVDGQLIDGKAENYKTLKALLQKYL